MKKTLFCRAAGPSRPEQAATRSSSASFEVLFETAKVTNGLVPPVLVPVRSVRTAAAALSLQPGFPALLLETFPAVQTKLLRWAHLREERFIFSVLEEGKSKIEEGSGRVCCVLLRGGTPCPYVAKTEWQACCPQSEASFRGSLIPCKREMPQWPITSQRLHPLLLSHWQLLILEGMHSNCNPVSLSFKSLMFHRLVAS